MLKTTTVSSNNHKYLLHSLFNSVYTKVSRHTALYPLITLNRLPASQSHITCLKCRPHHVVTPNTYPYTSQIHSNVSLSQDRQPKPNSSPFFIHLLNLIHTILHNSHKCPNVYLSQPKPNCNPHTKTTKTCSIPRARFCLSKGERARSES